MSHYLKARVHKSLAVLIAGPFRLHRHFSSGDMAREGETKSTFCALFLRTPTESTPALPQLRSALPASLELHGSLG